MRPASRIAVAYALIASIWIVMSDALSYALLPDGPAAQTIKGLLFVVVTSGSLWYLLERQERRREKLARRTEQVQRQLSALVETSPMAIIAVNPAGVVTLWNPAAERIFGWSAAEAIGKPNPIIPGSANGEYEQALKCTLEGREFLGLRKSRIRRDGTPVDVLVYSAAIQPDDPDSQPSIFALIADVTEQVHAEEELAKHRERLEELVEDRTVELELANERLMRATRVKSEFLANMSHELRTPLNSIIGFSGVMLQGLSGELNEEQERQVTMVYRAGRHLLALINDVLDLSRIEAGRAVVEPTEFDLADLLSSASDTVRLDAEKKGLSLEVIVEECDTIVFTDRTKVQQVVLNLLSNAVKFTDVGSVTVTLSCDDDLASVVVSDTGPGIEPQESSTIFDEFIQSRRRVDGKPSGTGLGLAISRRLARMLSGDVRLESRPGEGATFTFEFPQRIRDPFNDGDKVHASGSIGDDSR